MKTVQIFSYSGDFAENKDVAKKLRIDEIEPEIKKGGKVELDFKNVTSATQSFIHALISQVIRENGVDIIDKILFKSCNERIKTIIAIVIDYVQDGIFSSEDDNEAPKT